MKNERSNNIFLSEGINVLSLFDGMSCGQIALDKLGIEVDNYFASEIDKYAIKVTQINYPNTIQLGDVTKVKVKSLCLSEVYSYICNYGGNLQSNISEWEVLYWLNKDFTFSAKIRTQKPNERQEVSESSTIQRIKEVWFSNSEMGSIRKFGDYTRSGSNGEEDDIRIPQQLQCSKWGYDNDIYRRYKEENIGIAIRETQNGNSEKKNFRNIKETVFKGKESKRCFGKNEKSNVEKGCSGKLLERESEDRFSRKVKEEKRNGRAEENSFIDEIVRELCRWDEIDGIVQDYWNILRLHKEEQVTVVEYEGGFYIFKGKIDLCMGGSPCQGFSFAGKQLNFDDPRSKLFFEFVRLLEETKPKYFLLENVLMKKEYEQIITDHLGVEPIFINSALVSAQNRKRLYWTNIPNVTEPQDKGITWGDVRERGVNTESYYYTEKALQWLARVSQKKNKTLTAHSDTDKMQMLEESHHKKYSNQRFFGIVDLPENEQAIAAMRGRYLVDGKRQDGKQKTQGLTKQYIEFRYDGKTNALTTVTKDNVVVPFTLPNRIPADEFFFRYITPLECERLQTVPDKEIICIFVLCEEQVKNYVNAVEQNPKLLKLALSAEKEELNEFVKLAIQNTKQSNPKTKFIVPQNVGMQTQSPTKQYIAGNQNENNTTVSNVENIVMCKSQNQEEASVLPNAFINITEGRIMHFGTEELHRNDSHSTTYLNGKKPLVLFGSEIMELVKDVDAGMKKNSDMIFTSTTLSALSISSLEQMLAIYYLFAKNAITGYIPITTNQKSLSVQFQINDGYTSIVSNTQRYRMLGNGWTVDVIAHIFNQMAALADKERGEEKNIITAYMHEPSIENGT